MVVEGENVIILSSFGDHADFLFAQGGSSLRVKGQGRG